MSSLFDTNVLLCLANTAVISGLCVHSLRATAATNALAHEADIPNVQEWLDHPDISTTAVSDGTKKGHAMGDNADRPHNQFRHSTPQDVGMFTAIGDNATLLDQVESACQQAAKHIAQRVQQLGETRVDIAQGNFAEIWHAETFNLDTVLRRMTHLVAEAPNSHLKKSADILITDHGETVREYSAKYYRHANESINAQKGYGPQDRLIPADQMDEAHRYLDRQIRKDYATGRDNRIGNATELEQIRDKVTDRVHYDGAQSEPLTRHEAEAKLKAARRGEAMDVQPQIDAATMVEESLRSGAVAAGVTISVHLAPRLYHALMQRHRTGEWPAEALRSVFHGMGGVTAEASVRAAFATSITMSAKAGLLGQAARHLDPSLIGTLTFLAVEGAKDFARYAQGRLTGERYANRTMLKAVTATAGVYGAAIGQAVIPIPIVGAMMGAMVGSLAAQQGYQFVETLSEAYFRTAHLEEMARVNQLLAVEWAAFVADYGRWVQRLRHYEHAKHEWDMRLQRQEALTHALDRKLRQALEDRNA